MSEMTSPISTHIGQVFIPVRDVRAAAAWYGALLGIEPLAVTHHDTICDLPMEGDVKLALDANHPDFSVDGPPRFFWWAENLQDVCRHLEHIGADGISQITDIGSVEFIQFKDPDGNPLMVCAQNRA